MKLRYIFASIAAVLGLVACQKEADHYLAEIQVSSSYVSLPAEGGAVAITLNAEDSWSFDTADIPEWLSVSPTSGSAGETKVNFTAEAAESSREVDLLINCAGKTQIVKVQQQTEKVERPVTPIADVIAAGSGTFRIKGTVTRISSETYGNIYVKDDSAEIYIYGTKKDGSYPKDATGGWASFNIEVGDIVTLEGPYTLYGSTPELVDAELIAVEKSLIQIDGLDYGTAVGEDGEEVALTAIPAEGGSAKLSVSAKVDPLLVTSSEAWLKVTDVLSGGVYVLTAEPNTRTATRTATIEVKGPGAIASVEVSQIGVPPSGATVTEVIAMDDDAQVETLESTTVAKTTRGIVISDGNSALYVYGDKVADVAVGDNLKVWAKKTTYNGVPELTDISEIDVISSGNAVAYPTAEDITAKALDYTASVAEYVKLSGTLTVSGNYFNISLDGVDDAVKMGSIVYPTEDLDAKSFDGKKITVTGYFNGLSSKNRYINIIATRIAEFVDNPKGTVNNPYDASELASLIKAGETFEEAVYAKGIISQIDQVSTSYGNAQYWLSTDGSAADLEVYRGFWFNGEKFTAEDQIAVGDEVIVFGKVTLYKETAEFAANNYIYTLNGKAAPAGEGTMESPFNVTKAMDLVYGGEIPAGTVYVQGVISQIDQVSTSYGNAQYWISDNGGNQYQLEVYRGMWFGGEKFTSEDQIAVGDLVVVAGELTLYKETAEFKQGNQIVSLNGKTK